MADYAQAVIDRVTQGETQAVVAIAYAEAIIFQGIDDWKPVNRAIIDRWSLSGLARIKRDAWKLVRCTPKRAQAPPA